MTEISRFDERPKTEFCFDPPEVEQFLKVNRYSCIIGPNNVGKSFLLKCLAMEWKGKATYLGPARYSNFNALSPYSPQPGRKSQLYESFSKNFLSSSQNLDNSPFNTQQAIAELGNKKRKILFAIVEEILGAKLSLELAYPENEMSQRYISCNGYNFSYASSGTRLVVSILTSLMDQEYSHFLIDEPELGISPHAQGVLADFLFDRGKRQEYFPHIELLIFATHSALFLDKQEIGNNFVVSKSGTKVIVQKLGSPSEFNHVHFNLLGNRLESLFLPSYIFLVEGKTDEAFLRRVFETKFPKVKISVVQANGDARIKEYAHIISELFPDIQFSPYKDRIFPVLDSVHGGGIVDGLVKKGIPIKNIVIWEKNGIEFYYPQDILDDIFGGECKLEIRDNSVCGNGLTFSKAELANRVISKITRTTEFPEEFNEKILSRVAE